MKILPGKLFVYSVAIVFAVSCNIVSGTLLHRKVGTIDDVSKQTKRHMAEEGSHNNNSYAIVNIMDIPIVSRNSSAVEQFVAEIDLLSSTTLQDDGIVRLSFLVQSGDEDDISARAPFPMVADLLATSNLHRYATTSRIQNQPTDTISGFPCYRNLKGMTTFMTDLEVKASAIDHLNVEVIDIGDSYEKTADPNKGYDMLALKITGDGVAAKGWSTDKGIVFITCGVHAREYAPPELCARWAESLVDGYGIDTETTSILDHTEVHMIIESNPDGRSIAETNRGAYHRKNTRPGCSRFSSRGVDLNRNFPFKWGLSGSSTSKCDATYRGSAPASEPEVQAIVAYAESVFPESQRKDDPIRDINDPYPEDSTKGVYYDIHAYGNLIIWPWIYQEQVSANEESLQATARKLKSFNNYALAGPGQPDWLYPASGNTADYFYGELGALSFGYELGTTFYQDCSTFENVIVPDNLPGFVYTARISTKPYRLSKGPDVTDLSTPSITNYHPTNDIDISVTVSDSKLSSGPGTYAPSTQDIASISVCADMHPYDIDSNGNGPQIVTVPLRDNAGTTVTETILVPLSTANFLRDPLIGPHILYAQGTDSDGTVGPVMVVSFDITCDDESSFIFQGVTRTCAWVVTQGLCSNVKLQVYCPSTCNICPGDTNPPTTAPIRTPVTDSPTNPPTAAPIRTPVTDSPTKPQKVCKKISKEDSCEGLGCHWDVTKNKCKDCNIARKKKKCTRGGCIWDPSLTLPCFSCTGGTTENECFSQSCAWTNGSCLSCRAGDPSKKKCVQTNGCAWKTKKCVSCRELKKNECTKLDCAWNKQEKLCGSENLAVTI